MINIIKTHKGDISKCPICGGYNRLNKVIYFKIDKTNLKSGLMCCNNCYEINSPDFLIAFAKNNYKVTLKDLEDWGIIEGYDGKIEDV